MKMIHKCAARTERRLNEAFINKRSPLNPPTVRKVSIYSMRGSRASHGAIPLSRRSILQVPMVGNFRGIKFHQIGLFSPPLGDLRSPFFNFSLGGGNGVYNKCVYVYARALPRFSMNGGVKKIEEIFG